MFFRISEKFFHISEKFFHISEKFFHISMSSMKYFEKCFLCKKSVVVFLINVLIYFLYNLINFN